MKALISILVLLPISVLAKDRISEKFCLSDANGGLKCAQTAQQAEEVKTILAKEPGWENCKHQRNVAVALAKKLNSRKTGFEDVKAEIFMTQKLQNAQHRSFTNKEHEETLERLYKRPDVSVYSVNPYARIINYRFVRGCETSVELTALRKFEITATIEGDGLANVETAELKAQQAANDQADQLWELRKDNRHEYRPPSPATSETSKYPYFGVE